MDVDVQSENIAVSKASKSRPANKPGTLSTLGPHNSNNEVTNKSKSSKSIEETYQKLSQLDHILVRPDTYIGSTERQLQSFWVHDGERMQYKSVNIAPGLYKIFDEILVNAADNKVRDPSMDTLRVDVDVESGEIRILNNGAGVPVEIHKTEGIYVPELIFGHLLTSSNYNDNEKKVTGGRNGYGAKLANIFSKRFIVETCDGKRQRRYKQVFRDNMRDKSAPQITDCKSSDNWTRISFQPELQRFGMETLDDDTVSLLRKRVYDMSGILGKTVKVYFNGEKVPVKDFQSYIDLYLGPKDSEKAVARVHERFGDRWEVCIAPSDGVCNQVSFVNAICTSKGGTHVAYIGDQVVKYICDLMAKKHKTTKVKPFMVRNHMWVFVNCLIENPAFDSQTKDNLTLRASAFGSKCELTEPFLKKAAACGILEAVLDFANVKANKELKKGDGSKTKHLVGIPKLDDANDAGSRNSHNCTLILTEGDSAKSLAISGLSIVGRDKYGVFPLRGKLLNVRDAAASQITGNAEINNIKQILGLQHGKAYTDTTSLRYGHLMIMTDQDHDGSHIKGLIMNFLHHFYPSLLKIPGFLLEFITPIIKATKGKECLSFFTLPEYEAWCAAAPRHGWKIKYYKGLGTSTSAEAKEYFANIGKHCKQFVWQGDEDGDAIEMAFSKKRVEDRKDWLRSYVPGTFLDHSADTIGYRDFVHKELILFSRADLERSIPSMVDGLKPGQRKIIFSCFKRNLHSDIKVAQLAGYVAEHSAYHHGETSLATTIVGLAQNFVGSNNVNYLVPQGQFGTRIHGGKDAASARYIFTRLAALARHLFHQADDPLLKYLNEEGQSIEPEWYMPILPTVLLNGAEGIGTGWSTSIPNYDPRDIVDNLKALLEGKEMFAMDPWYRGFKGTIQEIPQNSKGGRSYLVSGIIRQLSDTTLEITELPIRKWTQDYKEFLEEMAHPEDKNATPFITEYKEYHTDDTVRFVVELPAAHMQEALAVGLHNKFKLTTKISIGNMMLFGADGIIRRYVNPEDIIREFYQLRLDFYRLRKDLLLRISRADLVRISNKVKFILEVVSGSLKLGNRKRADVDAELESRGYDRLPTSAKFKPASVSDDDTTADTAADTAGDNDNGKLDAKVSYEYLLSMPLGSLTLERVEALRKEASEAAAAVERLEATSEADMWRTDLDAFLQAYDEMEEEDARHEAVLASQRARAIDAERKRHAKNKGKKGNAKNGKGKKIKSRDAWSSSDGDEYDEDDDGFEDDGLEAPRIYVQRTVKERRPAPPPQAPLEGSAAAAAGGASTSSSSSGPGAGAGNGNGRNRKGQPPAPQPPAKREEEMSLVERMAMRMGGLDLGATGVTAGVSETSSSTVALPLKRSTARKPQGKPKAKSKAKSKAHYEDEDEIEVESDASAEWTDIELSERERDLADAHMQPSNSTKVTQKTAKTAKPSSRTAKAPAVGKKAAKTTSKKGANKKKVQSGIDSDLVSDTDSDVGGASDDESAMAPQHIKALPKRPVRSREARPRAYVVDVDDDDDDASDVSIDESEEEYVPSD